MLVMNTHQQCRNGRHRYCTTNPTPGAAFQSPFRNGEDPSVGRPQMRSAKAYMTRRRRGKLKQNPHHHKSHRFTWRLSHQMKLRKRKRRCLHHGALSPPTIQKKVARHVLEESVFTELSGDSEECLDEQQRKASQSSLSSAESSAFKSSQGSFVQSPHSKVDNDVNAHVG